MTVRRPSGFIEPCLPSKVAIPPSGPLWVHEIKHDGYRLMVRRDGARKRQDLRGTLARLVAVECGNVR
jgi:ATP-dependent DNA ligase